MNERVHLIVDNRLWQDASGIRLVAGEVTKCPENPLFGGDKQWELRMDNMYPNVVYDDDEGIFRCWYSPFKIWSHKSRKPDREVIVCYAQSRDGLTWTKPENNIVIEGPPIPDGPSTGPWTILTGDKPNVLTTHPFAVGDPDRFGESSSPKYD